IGRTSPLKLFLYVFMGNNTTGFRCFSMWAGMGEFYDPVGKQNATRKRHRRLGERRVVDSLRKSASRRRLGRENHALEEIVECVKDFAEQIWRREWVRLREALRRD